jgi:hypothetical protein
MSTHCHRLARTGVRQAARPPGTPKRSVGRASRVRRRVGARRRHRCAMWVRKSDSQTRRMNGYRGWIAVDQTPLRFTSSRHAESSMCTTTSRQQAGWSSSASIVVRKGKEGVLLHPRPRSAPRIHPPSAGDFISGSECPKQAGAEANPSTKDRSSGCCSRQPSSETRDRSVLRA